MKKILVMVVVAMTMVACATKQAEPQKTGFVHREELCFV